MAVSSGLSAKRPMIWSFASWLAGVQWNVRIGSWEGRREVRGRERRRRMVDILDLGVIGEV